MARAVLCRSIGVAILAGALGTACSSGGGANPDGAVSPGGHGGVTNGAGGAAGKGAGGGGAAGKDAGGAGGTAGKGAGGASGAAGKGAGGASGVLGNGGGGAAGAPGTGGGTDGAAGASGTGGDAAGAAGSSDEGGAGAGGAGTAGQGGGGQATPGDSVLMHHNHLNRDGVYLQPSLTKVAAAGLHLDSAFRVSFVGPVYAQPLYVDNGSAGTDLVIVATEADTVYAFDASSGQQVWTQTLGTPVPLADMPCGIIDPLGITGTPVIDFASRTLFVGVMTTPDGGTTKQYEIYGLSIDDGSVRPGWPIDMASALAGIGAIFTPSVQGQRGALAVVNDILYVPFGGLGGDCGDFRGWVVAIPLSNPQDVEAWSTAARGGGIWSPGGVASDGTNIFVTTGNTFIPSEWGGGEAVISFPASMPLATTPSYWAPNEWPALDAGDVDLGTAGPIIFDLPGATPSHLVFALGKGGLGYLEDANNLGGVSDAVVTIQASPIGVFGAHVVYSTATATYIAFRGLGGYCLGGAGASDLATFILLPGSPPTVAQSWCASATGAGSPIVTTSDGQSDTIVWVEGAEGNGLLQGFDGDTGDIIFAGGNAPPIVGAHRFTPPIAAKGRIFVAGDDTVVAFTP